ncbi:MAG: FAD-binding protein [Desulfobacterales bacterium]|nr:MAG: FAD-binding protein [Desulfobacterales bacterium]
MDTTVQTDVLVIGSEGAGCRAAIAAADAGTSTVVVTKGRMGHSGATLMAAADISADSGNISRLMKLPGADPADSPKLFVEDILAAGKDINNRPLVEHIVAAAPLRVKELLDWGLKAHHVMHAPGHRFPRGVATTGREIVRVLNKQLKRRAVKVIENIFIFELLKTQGSVNGAVGLDLTSGEFIIFQARATVLATGGGAMIYPLLTGAQELTGDGYAMAFRAGARLVDMEMIQFMPLCLLDPPAYRGSLFPFLLTAESRDSLDGRLLNRQGERFMQRWDPDNLEHTTRDKLSAAIAYEVYQGRGSPGGGVYLSFAHLPRNVIDHFADWALKPQLKKNWHLAGMDFRFIRDRLIRGEALEVGPACHFFIGGTDIDPNCSTAVPGLFAAGEVVGGLHGANRLSGNACMEMLVEGEIAGREAARFAQQTNLLSIPAEQIEQSIQNALIPLQRAEGISPYRIRRRIQRQVWENAGTLRSGDQLKEALQALEGLRQDQAQSVCGSDERVYNREWLCLLENRSLLDLLEVIARCALAREESRGVHLRKDWPDQSEKWQCNLLAARSPQGLKIERRSAVS